MLNKFASYFLLLFLSLKLYSAEFPRVLHFIWLGGAPHSSDEVNVKKWIANNPDYQVYIWYSATDLKNREKLNKIRDNGNQSFLNFTQNLQPSMKQVLDYFKKTFNQDNVKIEALEGFWDLLMQEDKSGKDKVFLDEHTKNNLITSFKDEININSPQGAINLAAASDIARVLLLYYYGGIYFDFDVSSKEDYKLDIPANSLGFKIIGKCSAEAYGGFDELNNNLLASVDHGQIIIIIAKYISDSYTRLYDNSMAQKYDDDTVSNFYKDLLNHIRIHYNNKYDYGDGLVELEFVQNFAQQQNIDIEKITLLQKKKFADVFYQKSLITGMVSASNEKKQLTIEYSGPEAIRNGVSKGLSSMKRSFDDSCKELIFPEKYVGPDSSPDGSWSF